MEDNTGRIGETIHGCCFAGFLRQSFNLVPNGTDNVLTMRAARAESWPWFWTEAVGGGAHWRGFRDSTVAVSLAHDIHHA